MRLSDVSIERPVFATVLSLLLIVVGLMAYARLTLRELPAIDPPVVSVDVTYPGASAGVVETRVTQVLEDALAGIEGIETLQSRSVNGRASVTIEFTLERDIEAAANDVRDAISRVADRLPEEANAPEVQKADSDSEVILWLNMSSTAMDTLQLTDYAQRYVVDRLSALNGVSQIRVGGQQRYAMRVWLDRDALAARGLTAADAEAALRSENIELPAGRIESQDRDFTLRVERSYRKPQDFAQIPLGKGADGYVVRLGDVARVELASSERRAYFRSNGEPNVGLGIVKTSTANSLDVARAARAEAERIQKTLPQGARIFVAFDSTVFIDAAVKRVWTTLFEAIALVLLVIWLFLGSVRAALIPAITVPVCLIASFIALYAFGFSINLLTLLALVLCIGLVVDDAIVVLENIYRHIEDGMAPFDAAIKGVKEIGFAVVAMTLTLAAVYAPLAFAPGRTGRLFTEFALALAGAVVVSGFVALTLSPMMCSLLLKHNPKPSWFDRTVERGLNGLSRGYTSALVWSLGHRWLVVAVMLGSGALAGWLLYTVKSELAPLEDRGVILTVINGPDGATLDYTNRYAQAVEQIGQSYKEFDRVFVVNGNPTVAQGNVFLRALPWEERKKSTLEIAREITPRMASLPGVSAFAITPPSLGQGFRERPVNFVIVTSDSYQNLSQAVRSFQDELAKNPGFVQVDTDLRLNKPEIRMEVDRERAADLGVSVEAVARAVETALGGRNVTRYKREGEQYDVVVQTTSAGRDTPDDIEKLFVRGKNDAMIPLSALVKIREVVVPRELNHFGQRRSASITANLAPDYSLGEALKFMDATAAKVLKPGFATDLNGISREFRNSSGSLALVFLLALLFIYLVLAAQFESFVDPFIIMLSVPLSMAGALLALKWSGGTLNVFSQIGLITLVGLITKHGILIVEFANQLREQGVGMADAIRQSASQRLRPILMTTGAMVLGAVPLALATGAGAESRAQIGWVIVGGMSLGTLLTIFVVPTMYTLLARKHVPGPHKEVTNNDPHGEVPGPLVPIEQGR